MQVPHRSTHSTEQRATISKLQSRKQQSYAKPEVNQVPSNPFLIADFFADRPEDNKVAPPPSLEAMLREPAPVLDLKQFDGLSGKALRDALRDAQGPARTIAYRAMRQLAFAGGLAGADGMIRDIYTERRIPPGPIPNDLQFNWEHLFAQGWNGLRNTYFRWHMFNGYPSDSKANNKRGHQAFGEVAPGTEIWSNNAGAKLGSDAHGRTVFDSPADMHGEIGHRMAWMYTEAPELMPKEFEFQMPTVIRWAVEDPLDQPDETEPVTRAEKIEQETLYYAHGDANFLLRAFVDVLEKYKDDSEANLKLYQRAVEAVRLNKINASTSAEGVACASSSPPPNHAQ